MSADAARWQRIQDLFHDALERAPAERIGFLHSECDGDAALIAEVVALLDEDAHTTSLLDRNLAEVAHEVLDATPRAVRAIGPYRLGRLLGEGGMGVVYEATREDLGRRVAVKMLRDATLSPARRERFVREQRTLAQLDHPAIARLYDADTLPDGTPWFVMEYVEGEPLTEYCARHAPTLVQRLELFRAVCDAVQFAHRHLIVHRDLKPSNILVTEDGSVKLLDFGIAKQLEGIDRPADQTRTELRMMTPAFAAPEQVRGEPIGLHTDVYALGVVLYQLLAGRLPFDLSNRTPGQVEHTLLEQEPEKPSVVAQKAGPDGGAAAGVQRNEWADLDVLCLTAMHKDPQRRYRSVEALIRDLDHFRNAQPLDARPDSLSYRARKFTRRNRRPLAATALVVASVVALVTFFTIRLAGARDAALAEAARTQRIQQFMLNLFAGGDESVGPADTLRVITLLDRGVREAQQLDVEPALQAELYATLGGIFGQLGALDRADTLLNASLAGRRSLHGEDHPETAKSLVALGSLRSEQAQLEEAERLTRAGLETARRHRAPDHPDVIAAMRTLGRVLQERGEYSAAIDLLEEVVRLQVGRDATTPEFAGSITELANTHFYAGDYAASDSLNRQAIELYRRQRGERHPLIGDGLINLGAAHFQRGNYAEAEREYRDALAIFEAHYGPYHPKTASGLTMLGRSLVYQDRDAEAKEHLLRALGILERAYGPVHPLVASAMNDLGSVALRSGDLAGAESRYARMVEIYREVYGDRHYLFGIAISNLGSVHLQAERYERAEPLFREAVQRFAETLSATHINTGIARIKLGRTLLRLGRYTAAETESLAGYEIVASQSSPSVSWLRSARTDLVAIYDALDKPDRAARFRAELADTIR
jgi:serine/threonine-protein kinase